ncbi:MAG: hypothetical protein RJA10_3751 [Pseudomonadota bacterium]
MVPLTTVIVFAKAPVAGLAKTRLAPALGAEGAAQLARRLLHHTVRQALAAGLGPVDLCVTPHQQHDDFTALAAHPGLQLSDQGDGDLGARMARALERRLASSPAALLIGTDAPSLDAATLQQAARLLQSHDAVFGPAADGGYVLVGLKRPAPELFDGMRWSHPAVMADTRQRLASAGLNHIEMPVLHDIDEPADLVHLPAAWRDGATP